MVLLKNDGALLPLKGDGMKLALVGDLAHRVNTGDKGSSIVRSKRVVTPAQGLSAFAKANGHTLLLPDSDLESIESAQQAAASADVVICVVGFTWREEGEFIPSPVPGGSSVGGDRQNLELRSNDLALVQAVSKRNENVVLVYVGGGGIQVPQALDKCTKAMLFAWYAGVQGGHALARILFGEVSPSGKLPFSVPCSHNHLVHFEPGAKTADYSSLHGYFRFDKMPHHVPFRLFGFGLSYSSFSITNVHLERDTTDKLDPKPLEAFALVTNTGKVHAAQVVQLYVGTPDATSPTSPVKSLRAFAKVDLKPQQEQLVHLKVEMQDLARYVNKQWLLRPGTYKIYLGTSADLADLETLHFTVTDSVATCSNQSKI